MSFEVRELTAEILEAEIIVQGCWQGSKLRVAYNFAGVRHLQKKGGNIENKTQGRSGQMCRAGLRKALQAYFSEKRESP